MTTKPTGEAWQRQRAEREESRPTDDAADHGTCDWGGCNDPAETWRYSEECGWLPVCGKCSRTNWDTTGPSGLPRRRR